MDKIDKMKVIREFEASNLGKRIKDARIKDGRSVEELAKQAQISRVAWWHFENEKKAIRYETLKRIETVLQVNLSEELYDGS